MTFADNTLTGSMTEWDSLGNVVKKIEFIEGRSQTPYVKKYPNGAKQHDGHYLGPKQVVKTNASFWTGIVDVEMLKSGDKPKRHGKWLEYYENGGKKFEGDFDEDQPIGLHVWWYVSGQKLAEGRFEAGKAHGHWTWWHENGLKEIDGGFDHGVQTGTWVHWKANGKVQEVQEHSLAPTSPQQAKPLVNAPGPFRQEQRTEAIQMEDAPSTTLPPAVHSLTPVPMLQERAQAPLQFRSR